MRIFLLLGLCLFILYSCEEEKSVLASSKNISTHSIPSPLAHYSPLEIEGRDLYIREGCYNCHTSMEHPTNLGENRYEEYSKRGEFVYDHPFKWGSKRVAKDTITMVDPNKEDYFLYHKIIHPRYSDSSSIMPSYYFLAEEMLYNDMIRGKLEALQTLGIPYSDSVLENAVELMEIQQKKIADNLLQQDVDSLILKSNIPLKDQEIIGLIAYLKKVRKRKR